jgi:mRNA interferase RelE/StbE
LNIYQVELSRDAAKFLKKLDKKTLYRMQGVIELLSQNPRPPKSKKLTNKNYWRVRVGDYRIIYEIHDKNLIIVVIKIANRRDAYTFHGKK